MNSTAESQPFTDTRGKWVGCLLSFNCGNEESKKEENWTIEHTHVGTFCRMFCVARSLRIKKILSLFLFMPVSLITDKRRLAETVKAAAAATVNSIISGGKWSWKLCAREVKKFSPDLRRKLTTQNWACFDCYFIKAHKGLKRTLILTRIDEQCLLIMQLVLKTPALTES